MGRASVRGSRAARSALAPVLALAAAPALGAAPAPSAVGTPPNVLVVLADDLGVDMLSSYGLGQDLPVTPNLDALAAGGVLFREAWAEPLCSPTRATLLTGRHPFRHGVGDVVNASTQALPLAETTLPELLDLAGSGYEHAAIGKWHLGNATVGGLLSPNLAGFGFFDGTLRGNLGEVPGISYYSFPRVTNGVLTTFNGYNTTFVVDAALDWIGGRTGPWFCYVAFHTPHSPFHAPPAGTYTEDLTGLDPLVTPRPFYKAMIESLDFELGRLLDGLGTARADTVVIFLGDNGTPGLVSLTGKPAKGSAYQGGVHVPLIVSGPPVAAPGGVCDGLVDATDLLPTVAELAGVDPAATLPGVRLDGTSLLPYLADPARASLRTHVFAERSCPVGSAGLAATSYERAVRDARFKLVVRLEEPLPAFPGAVAGFSRALAPPPPELELYDLAVDPGECDDLLLVPGPVALAAFQALWTRYWALLGS